MTTTAGPEREQRMLKAREAGLRVTARPPVGRETWEVRVAEALAPALDTPAPADHPENAAARSAPPAPTTSRLLTASAVTTPARRWQR
jgi:hypothetical protein